MLCLNNLILLHLMSANSSLGFVFMFFFNKMLKMVILEDDVKQRVVCVYCVVFCLLVFVVFLKCY